MTSRTLNLAFAVFHLTLAGIVFSESLRTVLHAITLHRYGAASPHVALLAGVETLAAVLLLLRRTLRIGGTLLLLIFAIAIALHGVSNELPLLVYAAGVVLVMVRGSSFSKDLFS
jgi:hypothetical protein